VFGGGGGLRASALSFLKLPCKLGPGLLISRECGGGVVCRFGIVGINERTKRLNRTRICSNCIF